MAIVLCQLIGIILYYLVHILFGTAIPTSSIYFNYSLYFFNKGWGRTENRQNRAVQDGGNRRQHGCDGLIKNEAWTRQFSRIVLSILVFFILSEHYCKGGWLEVIIYRS